MSSSFEQDLVILNKIKTNFLAANSGRSIKEIYRLPGGYLIVAPHSNLNGEIDYSDPTFVMREDTFETVPFVLSQNFELYAQAIKNPIWCEHSDGIK